ncbi:MAG: tryptophan synthase subunit alpha [Acidobacteriota bacterium]
MSRLEKAIGGGHALIPYLTASDPDDDAFVCAALGAIDGGARALEIGVPHSDPVADGPVIQHAHQRALAGGGSLGRTLSLINGLRARTTVPMVLFTYLNPVLTMGPETFLRRTSEAGVDGVLVLDLPPEEEPGWFESAAACGVDPIVLVSPNTTESRAQHIADSGRGFVYLVARHGVTGTHDPSTIELASRIQQIRDRSGLPVAVGFGVRGPEDVRRLWKLADGVVVGSALIHHLQRRGGQNAFQAAKVFVRGLVEAGSALRENHA